VSTVEPETPGLHRADGEVPVHSPGISGEAGEHGRPVLAVHQMDGVIAAADGTADHYDAVVNKLIHERRMLIPAVLIADAALVVPSRTVHERAQEVRHRRDVRRATRQRYSPAEAGSAGRWRQAARRLLAALVRLPACAVPAGQGCVG
jgi:hypothetical protein